MKSLTVIIARACIAFGAALAIFLLAPLMRQAADKASHVRTSMTFAAEPVPAKTGSGSQAVPASQPGMPLQVTSASITPFPGGRGGSFQATLTNSSSQDVVAYTIRWLPATVSVYTPGPGGTCHSRMATDDQHPLMRPGAVEVDKAGFGLRPGTLQAMVDLVVLSDGSAYGPNSCHELQRMQTSWTVHSATEEWALQILQSQGAQALEEKIKADLAAHAVLGRALLHPAYHPAVPPTQ